MSILSAIVTSLALASLALPTSAKSTDLTPDTFKSSVANGLWFVEHFSPYCSHCISFAPTWEKLASDAQTEIPSVRLAQVNCVVHGDLCDANNVQGYPTMQMWENGKMVEQFKGSRELDRLKTFIQKHVKDTGSHKVVQAPSKPKAPRPILNPTGEVLVLTSGTFSQALERGSTFVKFYAPWCGHCRKLAPIWSQLAKHMQDQVQIAEVNCDNESALCQLHGIKGYPTLMYFNKGVQSEYNGGRKLEQLKAFATKASAEGVRPLEGSDDLETHLKEEKVLYLLIHAASDSEIIETVLEAAAPLLGSPIVYSTSSKTIRDKYAVPEGIPWALIALKDHSPTATSTLYGGPTMTNEKIKTWLTTHHLPGYTELSQDTFQTVMNAKHNPLVLIAASNAKLAPKVEERIRDISAKWRARTRGSGEVNNREIVFTWMDTQRWKEWMKNMYGVTMDEDEDDLDDVDVVVADHKNLIYWDEDKSGSDLKLDNSAALFTALEDIAMGNVKYQNSENFIERVARYLNKKVSGLEEYISEHPLRFVSWVVVGVVAIFLILFKLLSNDAAKIERGEYVRVGKSDRID